jgi:hypothetical protein
MNSTEIRDMLIHETPVVHADTIGSVSPTAAAADPPASKFLKRNIEPGNSPRRICHVLEASGDGSGQTVLALVRRGISRGDDVTLVYALDRAEPAFVAALSALPGLKTHSIPMQRNVGGRDIFDGWRLYCLLRRIGPFDFIHAHSSKAGVLARIAGISLPGTTLIRRTASAR